MSFAFIETTMLYQVVMDEMNGPSVVSTLEMAFLAFSLMVGLVSIVFGNNVGTFIGVAGLTLTLGYFILFNIPWRILQWGMAHGSIFGNLGIVTGGLWLVASSIYIYRTARSIAHSYKSNKSHHLNPRE